MSPNLEMPTYIWPLHVPTKLQVHPMYISREMEFGPPPKAPSRDGKFKI